MKLHQRTQIFHNLEGVRIPRLLVELVNGAWPLGMGRHDPDAERKMTIKEAVDLWLEAERIGCRDEWSVPFFDYVWGRRLKLDLGRLPLVDSYEYDTHYGAGAFARAVERVRSTP